MSYHQFIGSLLIADELEEVRDQLEEKHKRDDIWNIAEYTVYKSHIYTQQAVDITINNVAEGLKEAKDEIQDHKKLYKQRKVRPWLNFIANPEYDISWAVIEPEIPRGKQNQTDNPFLVGPVNRLFSAYKHSVIKEEDRDLRALARRTHIEYAGRPPFVEGITFKEALSTTNKLFEDETYERIMAIDMQGNELFRQR